MLEENVEPTINILSFVASCRYMSYVFCTKNKKQTGKNWEKLCAFLPMIDKIGNIFSNFRGPKFQIFWGSMPLDPPKICSLAGTKCQLARCPHPKNAARSLNRSCKQHYHCCLQSHPKTCMKTQKQYSDSLSLNIINVSRRKGWSSMYEEKVEVKVVLKIALQVSKWWISSITVW